MSSLTNLLASFESHMRREYERFGDSLSAYSECLFEEVTKNAHLSILLDYLLYLRPPLAYEHILWPTKSDGHLNTLVVGPKELEHLPSTYSFPCSSRF